MNPIAAAHKLFRAFHQRPPKRGEVVEIASDRTIVLEVGELDGLLYKVSGDNVAHIHRFSRNNRPVLFVSSDGLQAYILAGGYRFTDRGFIG